MPNQIDMNQDAKGILGQLVKHNMTLLMGDVAKKVLTKSLTKSAEELAQQPGGQEALAAHVVHNQQLTPANPTR